MPAGIRQCLTGETQLKLNHGPVTLIIAVRYETNSKYPTQTWEAYSLGPVTSGTDTAVTSDCVLADLSVATHVTSILTLVNIWKYTVHQGISTSSSFKI